MNNHSSRVKAKNKIKKKNKNKNKQNENIYFTISTDPKVYSKKAITTLALAGFMFFYMLDTATIDRPFLHYDIKNIAPKTAYACMPGLTLLADNSINKQSISLEVIAKKATQRIAAEKARKELKKEVLDIVKNAPMKKMAEAISKRDRTVAAMMVGIAMKESKFGTYSPKKNGRDCYNYWGYRGRENTTASGYSCFDSPEQAVKIVGNRIESLVEQGADTPAEMIVWKCGSTCAGHSDESVRKWIADVSIHFHKINNFNQLAKN